MQIFEILLDFDLKSGQILIYGEYNETTEFYDGVMILSELEIVKKDSTKTTVLWILKQGKCPQLGELNCWLTQSVFMNQSALTQKPEGKGMFRACPVRAPVL